MITIRDFIARAKKAPFLDKGRDWSGWDCGGLVLLAYRECYGIELPDLEQASALDAARAEQVFNFFRRAWVEISLGKERPGDVAQFRRGRWESHVGLVIARGYLLHVEPGLNTCTEPFSRGQLRQRLVGIYRHVELS